MVIKNRGKVVHLQDTFALRIFDSKPSPINLICFPFIGGNSTHFRSLANELISFCQVFSVDPPGHGQARGRLYDNIYELIKLYSSSLMPWFNDNFFIFGHSLGGLISFLLVQQLEQQGIRPSGLILSAIAPPNDVYEFTLDGSIKVDRQSVSKSLNETGGRIALLANHNMLRYYMPIINMDYKVLISFKPDNLNTIRCPMFVMYSKQDSIMGDTKYEEWQEYGQNVNFVEVEGGHNYILSEADIVASKIMNDIIGRVKKGDDKNDT